MINSTRTTDALMYSPLLNKLKETKTYSEIEKVIKEAIHTNYFWKVLPAILPQVEKMEASDSGVNDFIKQLAYMIYTYAEYRYSLVDIFDGVIRKVVSDKLVMNVHDKYTLYAILMLGNTNPNIHFVSDNVLCDIVAMVTGYSEAQLQSMDMKYVTEYIKRLSSLGVEDLNFGELDPLTAEAIHLLRNLHVKPTDEIDIMDRIYSFVDIMVGDDLDQTFRRLTNKFNLSSNERYMLYHMSSALKIHLRDMTRRNFDSVDPINSKFMLMVDIVAFVNRMRYFEHLSNNVMVSLINYVIDYIVDLYRFDTDMDYINSLKSMVSTIVSTPKDDTISLLDQADRVIVDKYLAQDPSYKAYLAIYDGMDELQCRREYLKTYEDNITLEMVSHADDFYTYGKLRNVLEAKGKEEEPEEEDKEIEDDESSYSEEDDTEPDDDVEIEATQASKKHKGSTAMQKGSQKIYNSYKKFENGKGKIESQLSKLLTSLKNKIKGDKTEEILEGSSGSPMSVLKRLLKTGAIFSFSKLGSIIYLIGGSLMDKNQTKKQRQEILTILDTEIEIIEEKIEDAKGDANRKAKYAMMRTRAQLIQVRNKVKFGKTINEKAIDTVKDIVKSSKK